MQMMRAIFVGMLAVLTTGTTAHAAATTDRSVVQHLVGRHQLVGDANVTGNLSVTLYDDGSFDSFLNLDSFDCDFINFRASHQRASFDAVPNPPFVVDVEIPGEFALDATVVVLDAPLWVYPPAGTLISRGMLRRCGGDEGIVSFRMTIRSSSFSPRGRYDGEITAETLSGGSVSRSFSGIFTTATPRPYLPIIGFRSDRTRISLGWGGCLGLRWRPVPGANFYALEFVGPARVFQNKPFSHVPETDRSSRWGAVVFPPTSSATVCIPPWSIDFGRYEIRLFALNTSHQVIPGTGSSTSISIEVFVPSAAF